MYESASTMLDMVSKRKTSDYDVLKLKLKCKWGLKPHLHEQLFLDKVALTRKNCSCRWGIVDKFSVSRKIWRASFSLTRKNCQARNLLVYMASKENVARILLIFSNRNLSRETC